MDHILLEEFEKMLSVYGDKFAGLRNRTILITGATGMIATYLSEFLMYIAEDYNIQLYLQCRDMRKAEKIFPMSLHMDSVHLISFDFVNDAIPDIRFDYILHAASPASTSAFEESPVDVIRPNVMGTWYLLQHARNTGVIKFLLFSAGSVYGQTPPGKKVLTENDYGIVDPLWYRSCYVESKRLAEQMGMAFWRQYQVPVSFVRICHTYGPTFDLSRDTRIIPRIVKQILRGEEIEIYKDPDSAAQYTYIADMAAAILLVLLEGEPGEAYNAGADEVVKIDDMVDWMIHADPDIHSILTEKEIDERYRFGKDSGTAFPKLSNRKLSDLGWKQMYGNKDGFTRMVRYYIENNKKENGGGYLDRDRKPG